MSGADFMVPVPASIEAPNAMPIEEAIAIVCAHMGLPLLGGPSGRGWSYHATAQRCPHLFKVEQLLAGREQRNPAVPLQVGALYHFLQALFYAPGLGPCAEYNKGLVSVEALAGRKGRKPKAIEISPTAADDALAMLKDMAAPLESDLLDSITGVSSPASRRPSADIIDQAERAFDAHTNYYGSDGREDVTPLAMEWYAENEALEYTCRYDMIARLGENDPLGLPAGSIVVFERKTAAYLSEMATTGWIMDGEILGQILNWQPSGCEQIFGPLAAVVVDVVTKKAKTPQFLRVVVPPTVPMVAEHGRWIRYTQAQMRSWQANGVYPRHFTQCFDRWGKCGLWESCARGDKL
jgi:hypothetical protein